MKNRFLWKTIDNITVKRYNMNNERGKIECLKRF